MRTFQQRKELESKYMKFATIATPDNPLQLDCGKVLKNVVLAYEIFGTINDKRDNVILMLHAFSGDSHVGTYQDEPELIGWWANFIGSGKAFNTDKYAFLCSNVLGGCMGSTGPSSINPDTNQTYGLDFPIITIKDMVEAQKRLADILNIPFFVAAIGGSMGGMQVLQWAISFPDKVKSAIAIATTPRLSPQGIAFNEVGRKAIINDPKWNNGRYSEKQPPNQGLNLARAIGMITYLSDESMRQKFGRNLQNSCSYMFSFSDFEFTVESYLNHQGVKFTERFDANSYLYLTKAIDYFDLERSYGSLSQAFSKVTAKVLIMAFESDWLYPIYQSKQIVNTLQKIGKNVTYAEIKSNYGHDAFLIEYEKMAPILKSFIDCVYREIQLNKK